MLAQNLVNYFGFLHTHYRHPLVFALAIHLRKQVFAVRLHNWIVVVRWQRLFFKLVVQDQVEHVAVSAEGNGSQLIVIPQLAKDVLNVTIAKTATVLKKLLAAALADKYSEPHHKVSGLILFAVQAVVVERILHYLLEILPQLPRLLYFTRLENQSLRKVPP